MTDKLIKLTQSYAHRELYINPDKIDAIYPNPDYAWLAVIQVNGTTFNLAHSMHELNDLLNSFDQRFASSDQS